VKKIVTNGQKKRILEKLREKPKEVEALGKELKIRPNELRFILNKMQREGLVFLESYSGKEKAWLCEAPVEYLSRKHEQKKPIKRRKEKKKIKEEYAMYA
jgi:transcription initiation factor IIE alpha subunit